MNEHINELLTNSVDHMHKVTGQTWGINPAQIRLFEKFAELIIKECLEKVEEQFAGRNWDWQSSKDSVKDHFGVK